MDPTDLNTAFPMVARILGSALNERVELRPIVCHALTTLIEHGANKGTPALLCMLHNTMYIVDFTITQN